MILAASYPVPPMLMRPSNTTATLAVDDRGMRAILAAASDPENALDTIMADTYGRTFDQPSN